MARILGRPLRDQVTFSEIVKDDLLLSGLSGAVSPPPPPPGELPPKTKRKLAWQDDAPLMTVPVVVQVVGVQQVLRRWLGGGVAGVGGPPLGGVLAASGLPVVSFHSDYAKSYCKIVWVVVVLLLVVSCCCFSKSWDVLIGSW